MKVAIESWQRKFCLRSTQLYEHSWQHPPKYLDKSCQWNCQRKTFSSDSLTMIEPETAGGGVVFDMDLTKLSVWFIDWSPALLFSDSDYCGRWRRRYELQPTLCDKSCKRFPCWWFTAERYSPVFAAAPYHSFGYIRRRHACHWSVFLYLYLRHITP